MATHHVPSIFFYGEGKNNARLASQKTEVERRWDLIRVSERREKVMRRKVVCRVLELHSALSEVMPFREQAKRGGLCKNSQLGKTIKNISHHQPPSYATCAAALLASVFGSMTRPSMA